MVQRRLSRGRGRCWGDRPLTLGLTVVAVGTSTPGIMRVELTRSAAAERAT